MNAHTGQGDPSDLRHFAQACANLDRFHERVMGELHPTLALRLEKVLEDCGWRFKAWTGHRCRSEQEAAKRNGFSNAGWLESPHNYLPALAVDVVLDPRRVRVRENPKARGWPDLWDKTSAGAIHAWLALDRRAKERGLHRLRVRFKGGRDLPHLELPDWRSWIGRDSEAGQ